MDRLGPRPTPRGAALLLAGAVLCARAWQVREPILLWPGLFLILLPLLSLAAIWLAAPRLSARRTAWPPEAEVGQNVSIEVALDQRRRALPGQLILTDWLPAALGPSADFQAPAPGRGGSLVLAYERRAERRGRHLLDQFRYRATDPLGLATRVMRASGADEIVVTPRVVALDLGIHGSLAHAGEAVSSQRAFAGPDDVTVREYSFGDDVRRIHWRSSARTGSLMVRREEQADAPQAWLLLDSRTGAFAADPGGEDGFEWLVTLAASAGVSLIERGFDVTLSDGHRDGFTVRAGQPDARQAWLHHLVDARRTTDATVAGAREAFGSPSGNQVAIALLGRLDDADADELDQLGARLGRWALVLTPGCTTGRPRLTGHGWTVAEIVVGTVPSGMASRSTPALRTFG